MISHNIQDVKSQYRTYRRQAAQLADVYKLLFSRAELAADLDRWEGKENRVRCCGCNLQFSAYQLPDGQNLYRLAGADFCRVMLCPVCQWRRAQKLYGEMVQIWDNIFTSYHDMMYDHNRNKIRPALRGLLLTLTVPNVPGDKLRGTIGKMQKAWNCLNQAKRGGYLPEWAAVKGYYKTLEITYNAKFKTYHPHYHVLLLVDDDYFRLHYVTRDRWLDIWRRCYGDDSITQVDIRVLRGHTAQSMLRNLNEVCKYTVKPSDFLHGSMDERAEIVETLDKALHKIRRASYGGWLKEVRHSLKLDREEMKNLGVDTFPIPNGAVKLPDVWLHWGSGIGDYEIWENR